ncbi:MAG: T9SS type A sorting domain-containing protein [Bacteroidota bacterium]
MSCYQKHIITLLIILSFVNQTVLSQSYTPFELDNVEWVMEQVFPHFGPTDDVQYWTMYTTEEDTVINNSTYRLLYINKHCQDFYDQFHNSVFNDQFVYDNFAVGGLREDSKRLYFYKFEEQPNEPFRFDSGYQRLEEHEEYLLYDFNFAIGDTIHFSTLDLFEVINGDTTFYETPHFTIINSATGQTNGANTYSVSPNISFAFPFAEGSWIEGIGSSYGLFGSYYSYFSRLICYKIDKTVMLGNNCEPCTGLPVSTIDPALTSDVLLFPNPATDKVFIRMEGDKRLKEVTILDQLGRTLIEYSDLDDLQNVEISVMHLPKGIYMVNGVLNTHQSFTRKLIVL